LRILSLSRLLPVLLCGLPLAQPAHAQGFAGPYLAARQADYSLDFAASVEYGIRAITKDTQNTSVMESLLVAEMGLGQIDQALPIARRLHALDTQNQIAGMVLLAGDIRAERWDGVLATLDQGISIGVAIDELIRAWAHFGRGDQQKALETLAAIEDGADPGNFAAYQRALMLALAGEYAQAAEILSGGGNGGSTSVHLDRQGVIVLAQILSNLDRDPAAVELIDKAFPKGGGDDINALRAELAAGKPLAFDAVGSASQALSNVFVTVTQALSRELQPEVVLLYARTAEYLDPENYQAVLLSAALLESLDLYDLAVAAYARVPQSSRLYRPAALARAAALRRAGNPEEAIRVLNTLATAYPDNPKVQQTLGDTYRSLKQCDNALPAYDRAVSLFKTPGARQWALFFARGICREQQDMWDGAEADFLKALELKPDDPSVLNYLGYSWVEMGRNMDQALDMIERAVDARPEDGFITDSLGWVNYRLGNYQAAVKDMERAVELVPVDPVLNDHLGDVYWSVGRRLEAEFQWRRALSFITEDTDLSEIDPDRIRRKLEVGLDKVLQEEGAPPLKRSDEGG